MGHGVCKPRGRRILGYRVDSILISTTDNRAGACIVYGTRSRTFGDRADRVSQRDRQIRNPGSTWCRVRAISGGSCHHYRRRSNGLARIRQPSSINTTVRGDRGHWRIRPAKHAFGETFLRHMTSLLDIVLAYPRFVWDFFLLRGLTGFERAGTLSGTLLLFFLVGFALALLVGVVRPPDAEPIHESDPRVTPTPSSHPAHRFAEDIVRLTIVIVGGSLILHALMLLYSNVVSTVPMGNALDTTNAALGYGAIYLPVHAVLTRLHGRIAQKNRESKTRTTKPVTVALGIFQFLFPVFFLLSLSQVYGVPLFAIISPAVVSAIGTVVAVTGVVAITLLLLRGNPPVKG